MLQADGRIPGGGSAQSMITLTVTRSLVIGSRASSAAARSNGAMNDFSSPSSIAFFTARDAMTLPSWCTSAEIDLKVLERHERPNDDKRPQ